MIIVIKEMVEVTVFLFELYEHDMNLREQDASTQRSSSVQVETSCSLKFISCS